jgi:hypothetical protein
MSHDDQVATLAFMAALLAGHAFAEDAAPRAAFDPEAYPSEVRKSLRYANEECARDGGGKATFAPDTVRKLDLTGDGRDDYIVDFRDTECAGSQAVYCGTGGCTMEILVTLPSGKVRSVFNDRVRVIEILDGQGPSAGPRTIRLALHGSYCGGHGNPSCYKERRITAKPFKFVEPK